MNTYKPEIEPEQFTRRLYRLFRSKPYIFDLKKLRGARGYCWTDIEKIEIDYRAEILSTLVHESLHYMFPLASEKRIRFTEVYLMSQLSKTQVKNILKKFADLL